MGAVIFTKNYYVYILLLPVSTVIHNIFTSVVVDRAFPSIKPAGTIDRAVKRKIVHQLEGAFVGRLCQISRNSFDSIIISMYLGLSATAVYNNFFYILNALVSVMGIFTSSVAAGVGNSIATDSMAKNYDDFNKFNCIYIWIGGWCSICLLCFYQLFMRMWAGWGSVLQDRTMCLFVLYFFTLIMGNIRAIYTEAAGLWWENRYRSIMESVLNLLLNIWLGKIWGIDGVLLATLITIICINDTAGLKILFKHYFTEYSSGPVFFKTVYYFFTTMAAGFITHRIAAMISLPGFLQIVYICLVCLIVPNSIFFIAYFQTKYYKIASKWIKGMRWI